MHALSVYLNEKRQASAELVAGGAISFSAVWIGNRKGLIEIALRRHVGEGVYEWELRKPRVGDRIALLTEKTCELDEPSRFRTNAEIANERRTQKSLMVPQKTVVDRTKFGTLDCYVNNKRVGVIQLRGDNVVMVQFLWDGDVNGKSVLSINPLKTKTPPVRFGHMVTLASKTTDKSRRAQAVPTARSGSKEPSILNESKNDTRDGIDDNAHVERSDANLMNRNDWRGDTLKQVRSLIQQAAPDITEDVKWRKPANPAGVPVWSRNGIVCTGETYKNVVKLTFANGASLADPTGLFNASLEGNTRRAIDFHEGDAINEKALIELIRAAVALNESDSRQRRTTKARTPTMTKTPATTKPRIYSMSFARVYPMYVKKAEAKGRTKAEVDEIIRWLTGHTAKSLQKALDAELDIETFYAKAPRFHPNASLITGVVCGVRVEDIEDETMRKIRYLDKLIDELAKGKPMEKILRKG